ncbi:S-layer homology domain-containing protein [Patescibacteria group bacterium]
MKKALIVFIAGMFFMTCVSVYAVVSSFPDVPTDEWFYEDVMTLASWDVIRGYPDGYFRPGDYANRAEVSAIINRYDKKVGEKIDTAFGDLINSEEFANAVNDIYSESVVYLEEDLGELYYGLALGMVDSAAMYYNHVWNEAIFKGYEFDVSCDKFDPIRANAVNYLDEAKKYIGISPNEEENILDEIDNYKDMCEQL